MLGKRSSSKAELAPSTKAPTQGTQSNNWWQKESFKTATNSKEKWQLMEHNGVYFPEDYQRHDAAVEYQGRRVKLSDFQEELATYWTQTLGTDWLKNSYYKKNFVRIFMGALEKEPLKWLVSAESEEIIKGK